MSFGDRLKGMRKKAGLTQQELGEKIGYDNHAIWSYEKGRTMPHINNMIALADVFGISLDELVGHEMKNKTQ